VRLPPLRERPEDVAALAAHFLARCARLRPELSTLSLSPEALAVLSAHRWPGNVRELEHAIERAVVLADGPLLEEKDLPDSVRAGRGPAAAVPGEEPAGATLRQAVQAAEARAIRAALERTGGNRTRAAELLEISYRALLYKIKDYGLGS